MAGCATQSARYQAGHQAYVAPAMTVTQVREDGDQLLDRVLPTLVSSNADVSAAVNRWMTTDREKLIQSWVSYRYLRARMWPAFQRAGLPEALLFGLMTQESGGDVHAVSHSGAAGPLQFMPAAATRYGLVRVGGFDERFEPGREAQAAAAYLSESLGDLHGDFTLAVASYNAGDGLLRQLAAANPDAGFWARPIHSAVPAETRGFVPRVLAAAWLFAHPARYGLSFPEVDTTLTSLRLAQPIALNGLASCLGNGTPALAPHRLTLWNLNPRLDPWTVLPGGTTVEVPSSMAAGYSSRCVRNPAVLLAQNTAGQSPAAPVVRAIPAFAPAAAPASGGLVPTALRTYTVRAGDTLYSISRRFGCPSAAALARANDLGSARSIDVGQPLELIGCDAA